MGTSGATNLPLQVGHAALAGGALLLDINPEPNPFSQLARSAGPGGRRGFHLQGPATAYLPLVAAALAGGAG